MAEYDASGLLSPPRGQHHRRLVGQPLAEEADRASRLQGREDPQEEPAGKIQLLRRPDLPDRELGELHTITTCDVDDELGTRISLADGSGVPRSASR